MTRPPVPGLRPRLAALALAAALTPVPAGAHGDPLDVVTAARAQVVARPDDADAHLQLARAWRTTHAWNDALASLDDAAARGADADLVAAERAKIWLDAGHPRQAKRTLSPLVVRRDDAPGALLLRARACLALGRADKAATDYGRAVAVLAAPEPDVVFAWRDALLASGRREDALAALDVGLARLGAAASVQLAAIALEEELGRPDAALVRLDRLIATNPPNPAWLARRADLLAAAGRPDDARTARADALALLQARPATRRTPADRDLARRLHAALDPSLPGGAPE